MRQVRIGIDQIAKTVRKLVNRKITWDVVEATYPVFSSNS